MSYRYSKYNRILANYREQSNAETNVERKKLILVAATSFGVLLRNMEHLDNLRSERRKALYAVEAATRCGFESRISHYAKKAEELERPCAAAELVLKQSNNRYWEACDALSQYDMQWCTETTHQRQYLRPELPDGDSLRPISPGPGMDDYSMQVMMEIQDFMRLERLSKYGHRQAGKQVRGCGRAEKRAFVERRFHALSERLMQTVGATRVRVSEIGPRFELGLYVNVYTDSSSRPRLTVPLFFGDD